MGSLSLLLPEAAANLLGKNSKQAHADKALQVQK
jgi:hypothetical protein